MIWEISMWQTKQNKLPCFIDRWCGGGGGGGGGVGGGGGGQKNKPPLVKCANTIKKNHIVD